MRFPDYTATIREPLVCIRPGRGLVLRLSILLLTLIGLVAVGGVIWAEITGFNLNELPWIPRLALAGLLILSGMGIFKSIREEEVELKLAFYRDRLILSHDRHPSLWREDEPALTTEILYKDVTGCIFSYRRLRVTLQTKGYTQTLAGEESRKKSGVFSFSTLKAPDVDFAELIRKHSPIRVTEKT